MTDRLREFVGMLFGPPARKSALTGKPRVRIRLVIGER